MKKCFFLVVLFFSIKPVWAQQDTSLIYLRFPTVPPFKITRLPDSTYFTKDDLRRKKATLIMIFSPDCEHCQHETHELTAKINLLKNVQIIMASPLEYEYLEKFYKDYHLADYPNIVLGRDPGYFFGTFFHVRSFPSLFLYDKKGNFIRSFDGSYPIEQIKDAL